MVIIDRLTRFHGILLFSLDQVFLQLGGIAAQQIPGVVVTSVRSELSLYCLCVRMSHDRRCPSRGRHTSTYNTQQSDFKFFVTFKLLKNNLWSCNFNFDISVRSNVRPHERLFEPTHNFFYLPEALTITSKNCKIKLI